MTLLSEIIDAAGGDTVPVSTLLRKLKVLAAGPDHDTGRDRVRSGGPSSKMNTPNRFKTSSAPELRALFGWKPA